MRFGRVPHLEREVPRLVAGADFMTAQPLDESFAAFDAYWEAGGRAFDSAHAYGENSRILGDWLRSRGVADQAIYFDKGCHPYGRSRITLQDMRDDIRENHEKLGVEYTDFFVLHRDDLSVPVGEIVDWLNLVRDEGLIGAFGGSNWTHLRVREANEYASRAGKQGFSASSPNISLAKAQDEMWPGCLTVDDAALDWYRSSGFPVFPWSSMARGYFAHTTDADVLRVYDNEDNRGRRDRAERIGVQYGLTAPQIALAWTLTQGNVFALAGMRTAKQVQEAIAALEVQLSAEELHWLEHGGEL